MTNDIMVILEFYAQLAVVGVIILGVVFGIEKLIRKDGRIELERWLWDE